MKKLSYKNKTQTEWLEMRKNTIGASESAIVLGFAGKHTSSLQLWAEKVGVDKIENTENLATFMGKYYESSVANLWQYVELNEMGMIDHMRLFDNFQTKNIVRKCQKSNYIYFHKNLPMHATPDRIFKEDEKWKVLEIKTISGWSADQWIGGLPPMYLVQLQHQLEVMEMESGELFMQKNGRDLELFKFHRDDFLINEIKRNVANFWELVLKGREEVKKNGNPYLYEPNPDNSTSYEEFLVKRQNPENEKLLVGDQKWLEVGQSYNKVKREMEKLEEEKQGIRNRIMKHLDENKATGIDFGNLGKISWKLDKNGKRSFLVKVLD